MSALAAVRSFIDLREAASGEVPAGDFLTARRQVPLGAGPVDVEIVKPGRSAGSSYGLAADEFVIVLDGELKVDVACLVAGDSVVIPAHTPFHWSASSGTVAIAMRCSSGPAGANTIVPLDQEATLEPSGAPLAALLVGDTPSCRNNTDYRSANGEFVCGTWDSTPYHRLAMEYRHHELMHLLEGSVTFEDETGCVATFSAGDVFLIEQGARCSWQSSERVKKVYAIYRPAA